MITHIIKATKRSRFAAGDDHSDLPLNKQIAVNRRWTTNMDLRYIYYSFTSLPLTAFQIISLSQWSAIVFTLSDSY